MGRGEEARVDSRTTPLFSFSNDASSSQVFSGFSGEVSETPSTSDDIVSAGSSEFLADIDPSNPSLDITIVDYTSIQKSWGQSLCGVVLGKG